MPKRTLRSNISVSTHSAPSSSSSSSSSFHDSQTNRNQGASQAPRRRGQTEVAEASSRKTPNTARRTDIEATVSEPVTEEDSVEATVSDPATEEGSDGRVRKRKRRLDLQELAEEDYGCEEAVADEGSVTGRNKRKTKEAKEADSMPLAARTVGHKLFVGAHVSAAGGVHNAVVNSVHIGANAFALFLKSQRKWTNPPLVEEHCLSFHDNCKHRVYDQMRHVVPHGSYLVNLAHLDQARAEQAYHSYLDDLKRCERLGIKLYNIHPGNKGKNDRQEAIAHLAKQINRAHQETNSVITLLENMAAGGNVLGSTFEDLRDIISLVVNQDRIGVCIDTCHAFASGYDLRTLESFQATMDEFEKTVGLKYLRALHLNDSKAPFHSHRDLHANIGTGFLGLRAFHHIVNDARFMGLPMLLETPNQVRDEYGQSQTDHKGKVKEDPAIWAQEIKLIESLIGLDLSLPSFLHLESSLARQGERDRARFTDQVVRKQEKNPQKKTPA